MGSFGLSIYNITIDLSFPPKLTVTFFNTNHRLTNRSRRSLKENFIVPGTKWCGAGDLAEKYSELGMNRKEDTCCRAHDNCRLNIGAFRRRFGYFNFRPFTISNCACDRRFGFFLI